jgi:hypothetical protein
MGRLTLREEYFSWLYKLVDDRHRSYIKLARELHRKRFVWSVRNDENRCEDGLALRDRYIEISRLDEKHVEVIYMMKEPCSVLEVLVSLAERMNDLMYDLRDTRNNKTPKFFHHMLVNLNLNRFVDGYNLGRDFDPVTEAEIDEILEVWLGRSYGYDGFGGLFPLKKRPPSDQSRTELYYQMMYWLDENYG